MTMERAGALARFRSAIPRGRELPPEVFKARHRAILIILAAHAVGIAVFGIARGYTVSHSLAEASIVGTLALFAAHEPISRKIRATLAAAGLVTSSALLVHFSGGSIEMHFHFFVVLGLMTLYQDWLPYGMAFLYVVVHHGLMGALDPTSVYDHPAAQRNPWVWAGIHGIFVAAAAVVQLFSWHVNEAEHARAEHYRMQAHDALARRRQALQINDSVVQGLVVAQLANAVGEPAESQEALESALQDAKAIVDGLLGEVEEASESGTIEPGSLVRATPTMRDDPARR